MRLYEFVNTEGIIPKLVAVTDQLKTDLDEKVIDSKMTVKEFLNYLQKYDINVDKFDLYNMIKKPPLNKLIQNVQGEDIIFKGVGAPEDQNQDPNKNQKIVKSMADKART